MKKVFLPLMEVISVSKGGFITWRNEINGLESKTPACYIHLKEVGGDNEFRAKMFGNHALQTFRPGQKVEVDLSFYVHKKSRKFTQEVVVNSISHVRSWDKKEKMPWDY